jgi:hypothetical protein
MASPEKRAKGWKNELSRATTKKIDKLILQLDASNLLP